MYMYRHIHIYIFLLMSIINVFFIDNIKMTQNIKRKNWQKERFKKFSCIQKTKKQYYSSKTLILLFIILCILYKNIHVVFFHFIFIFSCCCFDVIFIIFLTQHYFDTVYRKQLFLHLLSKMQRSLERAFFMSLFFSKQILILIIRSNYRIYVIDIIIGIGMKAMCNVTL